MTKDSNINSALRVVFKLRRMLQLRGPKVGFAAICNVRVQCDRVDIQAWSHCTHMHLVSTIPAFEAQQEVSQVQVQAQVSRAVPNSLVIVVQCTPVLMCGNEGRPYLGCKSPIFWLPLQGCFKSLHARLLCKSREAYKVLTSMAYVNRQSTCSSCARHTVSHRQCWLANRINVQAEPCTRALQNV